MDRLVSLDNRNWKMALLERLRDECVHTPFSEALDERCTVGIHLAVFIEPYLSFLFCGQKTVESRFSVNKHPPFERVGNGDILVLKRTSGPVCGICRISNAWFYRLDPGSWRDIERYAKALCMDESTFWQRKRHASFATLMRVEAVHRVNEFSIDKDDPRSWVVVREAPPFGQGILL